MEKKTAEKKGVHATLVQKRDNIVKNAESAKESQGLVIAEQQLDAWLTNNNKRRSPERTFILKKIYQLNGPVDMETLHRMVCEEDGHVSRATIYNVIDLLSQIHLVRKVQLVEGGMSFVEKTIGQEPHGYAVCRRCGNITFIPRPGLLDELKGNLPRGFKTDDFSLLVHGICQKCQSAIRKAANKERKKSNK